MSYSPNPSEAPQLAEALTHVETLSRGEGVSITLGQYPVDICLGRKDLQVRMTERGPVLAQHNNNGRESFMPIVEGEIVFLGRGDCPNREAKPFPLEDEGGVLNTVSRAHAYLWIEGQTLHIVDINSANGTRVLIPEGVPIRRWKKEDLPIPKEAEKPTERERLNSGTYLFAGWTEIGGRREQEDYMEVLKTPTGPLFVVMDGHSGGFPQTQKAIGEALRHSFATVNQEQWNSPGNALSQMCEEINSYLQDHYPETGTTITMAHYNPSKRELSVANVGDTRAYLVAGNGNQCIEAVPRFTMDQARPYIEGNGGCVTPDGRVARYGDPFSGGINVPDTLGDYGFPTLKTPRMASYTVNDKRGVFLVMGTDGFWGSDGCNFITEKDLKKAVRKFTRRFGRGPNLEDLKQKLVAITGKNKEELAPGYRDNSTLLVAYIRP